jgi:DNA-binding XRE family transcriptional regulator
MHRIKRSAKNIHPLKGGEEMRISIKAARINADMTQEELANDLGINKATIVNWENGTSEPKISQLQRISELSGIPIDFIYVPLKAKKVGQ